MNDLIIENEYENYKTPWILVLVNMTGAKWSGVRYYSVEQLSIEYVK